MKYLDFITPPKGYGNVPFYWWNGESLDIDRLEWQLEKLAENGVSGIQINFICHCPDEESEKACNPIIRINERDRQTVIESLKKILTNVSLHDKIDVMNLSMNYIILIMVMNTI